MGADAPQWLVGAFVDALSEVGATADYAKRAAEAYDLIEMWNAPGRSAHNYRHLIHVLTLIDELSSATHDPDIVRLAAWYHGACSMRSSDVLVDGFSSAEESAQCTAPARERLTALGTPESVIDRVCELLHFVCTHSAPCGDSDAQVLVDADLGRLAVSPQEFAKYRELLRSEYSHMQDSQYYLARRRAVKALLRRDHLFFTEQGSGWEDLAVSNLTQELIRIDEKLRYLCPGAQSGMDEGTEGSSGDKSGVVASSSPEHDEDLISEASLTTFQTTVIPRRSVKVSPSQATEELVSTGVLPAITLVDDADPAELGADKEDDSNLSSLESAVDTLGLV